MPDIAHTCQLVLTDLSHTAAEANTVQMGNSWSSLLTEGNTAGVLISDDSVAGPALGYTE